MQEQHARCVHVQQAFALSHEPETLRAAMHTRVRACGLA